MFVEFIGHMIKCKIICVIFFMCSMKAFAGDCNSEELDKVEYFSEKAGSYVVNQYGGGQDIVVNMIRNSCSYNSYSKKYKVKIQVYWNGAIFRSEKYNSDGVLAMNQDGSGIDYSETYKNKNLKETFAGMQLLGGLHELSKKVTVENCLENVTIKLAILYKDKNNDWVSGYWWEIDSNERTSLRLNNEAVKTDHNVIYYYVHEKNNKNYSTKGDMRYLIDGTYVSMTEHKGRTISFGKCS